MIVVSDASPLRYLALIEEIEILPRLYGTVLAPPAVLRELTQPATPERVRRWLETMPAWLQLRVSPARPSTLARALGDGESQAILPAHEVRADVLLIDDWAGRSEAERLNLKVRGTLGILAISAQRGLVNLPSAISRLRKTNSRASDDLLDALLKADLGR